MTGFRQTLTLPTAGYSQTVQAYLWGAGGGAGGNDGARQGGAGTGGGYASAEFIVNPGDVVELTVGSAGWSGRASSVANNFTIPLFNTRTGIPIGRTTALPDASKTFVARWSGFLNNFGVWNTGTAVNGSTTSLANTLNFDQSYSVNFPFTIDYLFNIAAYYEAAVYIDGELLFSSGLDSWKTQESGGVPFIANISAGNHTVRIVANANAGATYGVWGVGLTIASTTSAGSGGLGLVRDVFNTRDNIANPPLVIPDVQILIDEGLTVADGIWSNLQNDYGMWEANPRAPSCSRTYNNVYFPYTGTYQIQISAANTVTLSIDGVAVYTTPGSTSWTTAFTLDYTVSKGYHTVSFNATYNDPKIIGAVAILISKSWSGATGGLAGPQGSSGGGGGSGAATTLVLNPRTVNETLIAVAVGGAGGGGAGATTTGVGDATAPGPRGRTAAGVSSPQTGQDQGDVYKDGGGGGAGGPGGPSGSGKNGFSSVGDSYGQAGTVGLGYLNPTVNGSSTTGFVVDPINASVANQGPYYDLLPTVGNGALPGELQAKHGGAVFIFTSFGPRVRTDAGWQEVKTIFVNVGGVWKQVNGMYENENGTWEPVVGTFVPTFEPLSNDFGILARPADHREIPPPPAKPPVYDSIPRPGIFQGCFVQGTQITMANGSTKLIENVEIGDQLLGKDGVVNTVLEYVRPTLGNRSLIAFNGKNPFMTSDHPVLMKDGTWKSIDPVATNSKYLELADLNIKQLIVGDTIATPDGTGFEIESIQAYQDKEELQLYNFSLNGNNTYVADNLVVHNKGGNAGCASTGSSAGCSCFVEGTEITMADGSIKLIEDVKIGEQLVGKDGVVNTVIEYLRPVLGNRSLIAFNGGVPFITDDHPVLMKDGTWKSVNPEATLSKYVKLTDYNIGQLSVGDMIATPDGTGFEISSIEHHQDRQDLQLYNFSLDGNHTYVANNLVVHNKCFIAGTEVLMQDGTWKNIEDVQIDEVLIGQDGSENQILKLHRPTLGINDHWLPHKQRMVSINNSEFATSEDHMFFTTTGWKAPDAESCNLVHKHTIEAEGFTVTQLQVGDYIVRDDGNVVEVTSIEFREDDPELQLYNFWTNGNHTYHVRMKDSQDGMLVHNKCFIAGTEVLMQDGTWKNIEDVDSDEILIGKDGSENQIIRLHRPTLGINDHWLPRKQRMVSINGSEFATSEDHMFFTTTGWKAPDAESSNLVHRHTIEAEGFTVTDLQIGDKIITDNGDTVEVTSMEFREDDPELQLYNFWTNGNHTYHVRLPGSDQGMLVHNKCFIAGTKVLMQDGTWKNIEDVDSDEVLIGQDGSENQIIRLHRPKLGVNDHWLPRKQRMVSINGSEFATSEDHMFFTTTGWKAPDAESSNLVHQHTIEAEGFTVTQLQVGDKIITDSGDTVEVMSMEFRDDDPELQLYNFWTNGNHTYHVRLPGSDQGMLVHNKCFIAGTEVLMQDGTWKNIEDVQIDEVLIGKDGSKNQILKLHRPQLGINDHWLPRKQRMTSINGSEFSVSDDHMFFTTAGWKAPDAEISNLIHQHTIEAEGFTVTQLQIGDFIVSDNGDITEVTSIEFREDAPDLQLYNFWTNGNHTYHVRMKGVDQGMLVHNKCFIAGSKVLMHDGTWKNIEDVNIGDWVYNFDQTKINQVLFVETQLDNNLGFLYSPDQQHQPFATANHPLYVNGKLSSLDPEKISNSYPWIDKTELLETTNTAPPNGSTVYNLWTDNDHTFTVNGYGTYDMVSGGGVLRLMVEQGLMPASRANELIIKFDGLGKYTVYGLYALSQVLGKANIRPINKLTAWVFADDSKPVAQKMFYNIARAVGSVICLFKRR